MATDREQQQANLEIARLRQEVDLLKKQIKHHDKALVDVQHYVNELLKRAGIKGGFRLP